MAAFVFPNSDHLQYIKVYLLSWLTGLAPQMYLSELSVWKHGLRKRITW